MRHESRGGRERGRVPHVLFGVAVVLLAGLAAWWLVFLNRAIETERELRHALLVRDAEAHARELAESTPPGEVPRSDDPRFIVTIPDSMPPLADVPGTPWQVLESDVHREQEQARARSQRAMVHGEGALLILLVATCVVMLYRLVLAERRYRRDIDAFLGRATHEMKTPLAGLRALLQTVRDGDVPPERLREVAVLGLRQVEREEHLVENMLVAHRTRTRVAALSLGDIDVRATLLAFAEHRRESMGLAAAAVVVECPGALLARGEAAAITTILENLADNAFKYGATRIVVEGSARSRGGAIVRVRDDGEGFEPAIAGELFAPFRRGETSAGARHGTGLGLPIARALATEMGGALWASSPGPGRGATFELELAPATAPRVVPALNPDAPGSDALGPDAPAGARP